MAAWVGLIESWSAVTSWHAEHQRPSICPPVSFPSGLKKKEEEGCLLPSGTPGLVSECVDVRVLWKTLPHQQNVAPSCRWEEWKRFFIFYFSTSDQRSALLSWLLQWSQKWWESLLADTSTLSQVSLPASAPALPGSSLILSLPSGLHHYGFVAMVTLPLGHRQCWALAAIVPCRRCSFA